ncbi:MAG TPA: hypothetical protein VGQ11_08295 [Candidatus Acidoferrales bacterium]|nr:hypothetical protein [Candidatus Acidoferrales bacterium]
MAIELHELHRRRLEATLKLLSDSLARIDHQLAGNAPRDKEKGIVSTLSAEAQAELLAALAEFRGGLAEFSTHFELQRHAIDIRQFLNAEFSTAWVMLENCRPRRMKGYGVVFEEAAKKDLEANVEKLLLQVSKLRALIA